ncbi:MAG: hypothetical protein ACRDZO_09130 [Egibacteraceae bacterium]
MRTKRAITIATTLTALASLALPAHAGSIITAADCTGGGGTVINGACQGGTLDGRAVMG